MKYKALRMEITGRCNLHCLYCHAARLNTAEAVKQEMTTDRKISLINEAKELGCNEFTLIGGEPFLAKDLPKIINECGPSSIVNITTNGHFFNDCTIAWLKKYPQIQEFRISIDGLISHDLIRKGSNYKIILMTLEKLVKLFPKKRIVVQTTCNQQNIGELLQLYEMLKKIKISRWRISQLWKFGRTKKNEGILEFADYDKMFEVYKKLIKRFHIDNKPFKLGIYNVYNSQITAENYVPMDINTHPCLYHFTSICIKANGELTFCPALDIPFASVKKQSLRQALKSRWLSEFKKITIGSVYCSNCRYIKLCGGGCRADAYAWLGDIRQLDPVSCCLMTRVEKQIVPILSQKEQKKYYELINQKGDAPLVEGRNVKQAVEEWQKNWQS